MILTSPFVALAGTTRLELATSGVTGRRSNQLNYAPSGKERLYYTVFQKNGKAQA